MIFGHVGQRQLRHRAAPVGAINDEVLELGEQLVVAMRTQGRTGCAAQQIGHRLRVAALETAFGPLVVCNPQVLSVSDATVALDETCGSLPGLSVRVLRPTAVQVRFLNLEGAVQHLVASDARSVQGILHTLEHLDGHLLLDRLGPVRRQLALRRLDRTTASA